VPLPFNVVKFAAMSNDDEKKPPAIPPQAPRIQLQLDEALSQGVYTNLVLINHTENEFVLDFAYLQPSSPMARVRARIISAPRHTKRLMEALKKNLARYEERFGVIEVSSDEEPTVH
jgi:hypothetical protein